MGGADQLQIDPIGRSRDMASPDPAFVGSLECEHDPRNHEIGFPHRLSSVYFEFKAQCFCLKGWRWNTNIHGFTAQDGLGGLTVEQCREVSEELDALGLTNLVIYDDQGRPESLMFGAIPFYILEIVKNHNARLAEKDAEMGSLQSQVTDLEARMAALEQAAGVSGA